MPNAVKNLLFALGTTFTCTSALAENNPKTTGSLFGDAELIITSKKRDVRLWAHAPRLLVFGDESVEKHVRGIVGQIERAVNSPFGTTFFGKISFEKLPTNFGEGQQRLRIRLSKGGPSGREIHLSLGENSFFQTDIIVVVADRSDIALVNGLWGMSPSHNRSMLEGGEARCFYSSRTPCRDRDE